MGLQIRALFIAITVTIAAFGFQADALNVKLHGVNYDLRRGPDWDKQRCKSNTIVARDLEKLSQVTNRIRIYSLEDCNVRQVLRTAPTLNMTVWLGMWVSELPSVFNKEVAELRSLISEKLITEETITAINVGSEALYREETTAEILTDNFKTVREVLTKNGLNITLSITDTLSELLDNPELIELVDVISFNQFPFWNNVTVESAVPDLKFAIESLSNSTNSKPFVIAETGWAAGGYDERASVASPENAALFMKEFYLLAEEEEWEYYYFVAFDAPFLKTTDNNKDSVEAYFGIYDTNGKLNSHFEELTIPAKKMRDGEYEPLPTKEPSTSAPDSSAPSVSSITYIVALASAALVVLMA